MNPAASTLDRNLNGLIPGLGTTFDRVTDYDLYLRLQCDRYQQTFVARQYATHPFRVSNGFHLEGGLSNRIYLYLMNTSPGLMEGDRFRLGIQVDRNAQLYLTDQAATKVHRMPAPGSRAIVDYDLSIAPEARLEFVPEPFILYAESTLEQYTNITFHPTGTLFLTEVVVPGRLARQEYYQFNRYSSRLRIQSPDGQLMMGDAMRLEGVSNRFQHSALFTSLPIIGTAIAIYPDLDLHLLEAACDRLLAMPDSSTFIAGYSRLPNCNGLMIRAMGDRISAIQRQFALVLDAIRTMTGQQPLPEVPK